tara:strand:- start:104 stop:1372 length:1269 start_codon:yes stop_codon:yes gene_type:complete
MVLIRDDKYTIIKREGLVKNLYNDLDNNIYNIGIGHVRYKTSGVLSLNQTQPFIIDNISLCHNGNIYNYKEIENYILKKYNKLVSYNNDSELLLKLFYYELENKDLNNNNIKNIILNISNICKGSYSVIIMIKDYGLICFKDKYGIRPLIYGKNDNGYIVCSESIAIDNLDYNKLNEIEPGEMLIIKNNLEIYKKLYTIGILNFCIFEYIYISRPETILNNINVYDVRLKLGEKLGYNIKNILSKNELHEIDYVIPIPQTSKPVALRLSEIINKPYREGIINNRYIDRTFIMNNQKIRNNNIKLKMSVVNSIVKNKNIVIVDDSIVRGNTIKHIIQLLKNNNVKKIYVCICCPPIKYKNIYGIDIPSETELIANNLSINEIEKKINVNKLIYLNENDMINCIKYFNNSLSFDLSIFNGNYII